MLALEIGSEQAAATGRSSRHDFRTSRSTRSGRPRPGSHRKEANVTELDRPPPAQFEQTIRTAASRSSRPTRSTESPATPTQTRPRRRIHELKGRPPQKPSAVMYFQLDRLLAGSCGDFDPSRATWCSSCFPAHSRWSSTIHDSVSRLPARATPEQARACASRSWRATSTPLAVGHVPVMQTSANLSGAPDATALEDIDDGDRAAWTCRSTAARCSATHRPWPTSRS